MIQEQKKKIRKEMIRRLEEQDPSLREERSLVIQERLLSSEEFTASKTVMTYVSMPTEVGTRYFIEKALEQGKHVTVPYIGKEKNNMIAVQLESINDLEQGPFGIYQPREERVKAVDKKEIDLVVMPGIAFDRGDRRLGRGGGYYDRFLADDDLKHVGTVALAFSFQIMDTIPADSHDRTVDRIITD